MQSVVKGISKREDPLLGEGGATPLLSRVPFSLMNRPAKSSFHYKWLFGPWTIGPEGCRSSEICQTVCEWEFYFVHYIQIVEQYHYLEWNKRV